MWCMWDAELKALLNSHNHKRLDGVMSNISGKCCLSLRLDWFRRWLGLDKRDATFCFEVLFQQLVYSAA